MFDFKTECIETEGMHGGWQTSGTVKVCRLVYPYILRRCGFRLNGLKSLAAGNLISMLLPCGRLLISV